MKTSRSSLLQYRLASASSVSGRGPAALSIAPANARTDVRGNVVTCVLADAVGDFNRRMIAPRARDTVGDAGKLTPAAYKREAVAAVVRLTRQRVASFVSSHDRDTDVATEVFTLEPSLSRGAPRAERRFRHATWLPPPRARAGA